MQISNRPHLSLKKLAAVFSVSVICLSASSVSANPTNAKSLIRQSSGILQDTVKMISGVPLKPEDISPLLPGEQIPLLSLPKSTGKPFDLNRAVSLMPTILVFYREGWCPYCNKQLSGLQEIEPELTRLGYQIIAISTDSPENLSKTMTKDKLSYTLLSDADLSAAKKFGVAFKGPKSYDEFLPAASGGLNVDKLLPVPSVFILDKKGKILFEYINPDITQRLSAPLLKAAAEALHSEM